jgi:hypothetical protein
MKAWIKHVLGSRDEPQANKKINAVDDYVVVKKNDLEALIKELQDLRDLEIENAALRRELKNVQNGLVDLQKDLQ